jgi:Uncharacterised protein family (UPF0158)
MDSDEQRSALRAAVYRGDGPAVVDLLGGVGADDDSLQLAGDGVIAAVMQRVDGAAELAGKLVVGLRRRGWDGDDELADQLEAQLGSRPAAMLLALPVDLEELAGILEGDPLSVGGRIDIRTGEVWSQAAIEYVLETGEEDEETADDSERWLAVHGEGSREGYRDMEVFIASVEDPGRAERLANAIRGRGVFRRFKDELARWPGELERWLRPSGPAGADRPFPAPPTAADPGPAGPQQPAMDTPDARPLALADRFQHDPRQDPRASRAHLTRPRAQPTPKQTSRPTPAREACPETVTQHPSVTLARRQNTNRAPHQASNGPDDRSPRPKPPRQPPAPPLLGVFRFSRRPHRLCRQPHDLQATEPPRRPHHRPTVRGGALQRLFLFHAGSRGPLVGPAHQS